VEQKVEDSNWTRIRKKPTFIYRKMANQKYMKINVILEKNG